LAAQAQSTLATVESDIELAGYEPAAIRAPVAWLSNRRQAAEELRVLGTRLLVEDVESQTPVAARLEALAAHLEGRPWSSDHARA
jgi:hypothetical protein